MPAAQQGDDEDMLEAGEHELPSQGDREDAAAVAAGAADLSPSNPCLRTEGEFALAQSCTKGAVRSPNTSGYWPCMAQGSTALPAALVCVQISQC
jgi:hypothetical protein